MCVCVCLCFWHSNVWYLLESSFGVYITNHSSFSFRGFHFVEFSYNIYSSVTKWKKLWFDQLIVFSPLFLLVCLFINLMLFLRGKKYLIKITNIKINRFHRKSFRRWRFFCFKKKVSSFEMCSRSHQKSLISLNEWMKQNNKKKYLNW